MYLYILVFVITWSSLAQESWNMLEINYGLLGVLPKKVHFCLIPVTEHTVFTEEYVFHNCIHKGNMSRWNFRNLSRLITTGTMNSSKCIKHDNKSFVRLQHVSSSVTRWPSEFRLSQTWSVNVVKERLCININFRTKLDKQH
jgi:hypothetical protein